MKIKNLYTVDGIFNSNGQYIPEKTFRTIIAECVNDNIDYGCYYFAFLTYKKITEKKFRTTLSFIEIPDLFTFMKQSFVNPMKKIQLEEELVNKYEQYITVLYNARNTIIQEKTPNLDEPKK